MLAALLLMAFAAPTPEGVLAQARDKLRANAAALQRYACTQTIERELRAARVKIEHPTCEQVDEAAPRFTPYSHDRLRLDLVVAEGSEHHQWVNGGAIERGQLLTLAYGGALGTGDFSGFTSAIFTRPTTVIAFDGETRQGLYRYRYSVPQFASAYVVGTGGEGVAVGYSGTFMLDAATAELRQLSVIADDTARAAGWCAVKTDVEFERVRLRGGDVLLPKVTHLETEVGAIRAGNDTHYSQCREFSAQSTIRFELSAGGEAAEKETALPYPRDTLLTLKLETPIDSRTAAAGDEVRARADDNRGALFHGRILRLSYETKPEKGIRLTLLFNEVELDGRRRKVTLRFAGRRIWFPREVRFQLRKGWASKWTVL